MSALHNGQIRTMKANYVIETGDVRVIRPLIYVRETATRDFSQSCALPIINENCPACFEQPKERARMKKLMEQEESMVPALFYNLKKALLPLLHDDFYEATKRIVDGVEEAGSRGHSRLSTKRSKVAEVVADKEGSKGQVHTQAQKRSRIAGEQSVVAMN